MSARITLAASLMLFAAVAAIPQTQAAEEKSKNLPLSIDEMHSKRRLVREELMLPSLSGLKGIVYRVVGYKDSEALEKQLAAKLAELKIPAVSYAKAETEKKPCDAILQISFYKTGSFTTADLKLTQWVSLLRNPKIAVKAVTYSNKAYLAGDKPERAVEQLAGEFVLDYLKANQKGFNAEKFSEPAKSSGKSKN